MSLGNKRKWVRHRTLRRRTHSQGHINQMERLRANPTPKPSMPNPIATMPTVDKPSGAPVVGIWATTDEPGIWDDSGNWCPYRYALPSVPFLIWLKRHVDMGNQRKPGFTAVFPSFAPKVAVADMNQATPSLSSPIPRYRAVVAPVPVASETTIPRVACA